MGRSVIQKMIDEIDVEIKGHKDKIDTLLCTRKRLADNEKERQKGAAKKKTDKKTDAPGNKKQDE